MTSPLSDRVKGALEAFVVRLMAKYDYAALYPCTVVAQNGDGTLDLRPDASTIPAPTNVPLRLGIPGVAVKVASGSRVLLGFENADPQRPVATVWELSSLKEITITASTKVSVQAPQIQLAGGRQVARVGDLVQVICTAPGVPAIGQIITGSAVSGSA